jgi:hypothetical protein
MGIVTKIVFIILIIILSLYTLLSLIGYVSYAELQTPKNTLIIGALILIIVLLSYKLSKRDLGDIRDDRKKKKKTAFFGLREVEDDETGLRSSFKDIWKIKNK